MSDECASNLRVAVDLSYQDLMSEKVIKCFLFHVILCTFVFGLVFPPHVVTAICTW